MLGRATLTIETSSRVMNPAASTTASAFQRLGSGRYSSWLGFVGRIEAAATTDRFWSVPSVVMVMATSSHYPLYVQPDSQPAAPPSHRYMPWRASLVPLTRPRE